MEHENMRQMMKEMIKISGRVCQNNHPCCLHFFLQKMLNEFDVQNTLPREGVKQKHEEINKNSVYNGISLFVFLEEFFQLCIALGIADGEISY